jgi:hypothetical protein
MNLQTGVGDVDNPPPVSQRRLPPEKSLGVIGFKHRENLFERRRSILEKVYP